MRMGTHFPSNFYVDYISGKQDIDDITKVIINMTDEMFRENTPSDLLLEWMRGSESYYGWRSIYYFLYEYEIYLQNLNKSKREKISWKDFSTENFNSDYETVEHIYPRTAKNIYWKERFSSFTPAQRRALRNSLGNLLALSKPRNSSLGNKSFPEKLGDDSMKTGYRYGSYSENEVALYSEWSTTQIVERGIKLLNFLEKRWNLNLGDKNQKIRALGLSFLIKD